MNREEKRRKNDIAKHLSYEEMKLKKQAGNVRRSMKQGKSARRPSQVTEANWEDVADAGKGAQRAPTLGEVMKTLRPAETGADGDSPQLDATTPTAMVISVSAGRCRVFQDGNEIDCLVPPELAVMQKSLLAVGDLVVLRREEGVARVAAVLPRRTVLSRPDPLNKHLQRLIAANVDVVIHVVSVKAPALRPRLIDRYLIAIQRGGAQPVICANKIDLLGDRQRATELALLDPYRALGVPVVACSTKTGEGLDELRSLVEGKTSALVGHSGVGKSSILNAIDQRLQLATNELHRRGTGRHTTTASTLYDFGEGTYLIDTPGIREFGLWDLDRESLREYFPEFTEPSVLCQFNDCSHIHEPRCEVRRLLEAGEMNRPRYDTYARLYEDLAK